MAFTLKSAMDTMVILFLIFFKMFIEFLVLFDIISCSV